MIVRLFMQAGVNCPPPDGMQGAVVPTDTEVHHFSAPSGVYYGDMSPKEQLWPLTVALKAGELLYNNGMMPVHINTDPFIEDGVFDVEFTDPGPKFFCAGTNGSCPEEGAQVLDAGMSHECGGILEEFKGHQIHIVLVDEYQPSPTPLRSPDNEAPKTANRVTYQDPVEGDWMAAAGKNASNVAHTEGNETEIGWMTGGSMFLIGTGHRGEHAEYVLAQPDLAAGSFIVRRSLLGSLSFEATGLTMAHRSLARAALKRFAPDTPITFK